MKEKLSATDFRFAMLAGEAIAVFALPIFNSINAVNTFASGNKPMQVLLAISWLIAMPLLTATGLSALHRVAATRWPTLVQIGKYGIVGMLNTVLSIGVFNALMSASRVNQGLLVNGFALVAFVCAATNSFFWNKFWTFGAREVAAITREYGKFLALTGTIGAVNILIVHLWVNTIGAPERVDPTLWANAIFILLIPLSFFGNYFGCRRFIFRIDLSR